MTRRGPVVRSEWWLGSAEERHFKAPRTFHIPGAADRRNLQPGDMAKLLFDCEKKPNGCRGERMWVLVVQVCDEGDGVEYGGVLANEPAILETLAKGDEIWFSPEHIADIDRCPS